MELFNFDYNKLERWCHKYEYIQLEYEGGKPEIWIESGFRVDDGPCIDEYILNFSQNNVLLKFNDELEKAAKIIYNVSRGVCTNLLDSGDDVVFSIDINILDLPIVKDSDNRVISFEKLVDVDSFGRLMISIEGFYKYASDSDILADIKVKEIILKT